MRLTAATSMKVAVGLLACFAVCLVVIGHWSSSSGTAKSPASPTATGPGTVSTPPESTPSAPPAGLPPSITRQLVPLLKAVFTVEPQDTDQTRLARIKPLVPSALLSEFRQSFGYPSGTSLTATVQLGAATVERPSNQLYVITPVRVTVTPASGQAASLQYLAATTWTKQGSWRLVNFGRNDGRLLQEVNSS